MCELKEHHLDRSVQQECWFTETGTNVGITVLLFFQGKEGNGNGKMSVKKTPYRAQTSEPRKSAMESVAETSVLRLT